MLAAVVIECGYTSDKGSLRGILEIKLLILNSRVNPFSVALGCTAWLWAHYLPTIFLARHAVMVVF